MQCLCDLYIYSLQKPDRHKTSQDKECEIPKTDLKQDKTPKPDILINLPKEDSQQDEEFKKQDQHYKQGKVRLLEEEPTIISIKRNSW